MSRGSTWADHSIRPRGRKGQAPRRPTRGNRAGQSPPPRVHCGPSRGRAAPVGGPRRRDADHPGKDRLARSHLRADVQRQERGAHPPHPPGGDRAPARAAVQAVHRRPLQPHEIVSHSQQRLPSTPVASSAGHPGLRRRQDRGGRHRRGPVLRRRAGRRLQQAGRPGQTGHRGRPGHGLPRPAVRPHAASDGHRGVRDQAVGDLRALRESRQPHPAAD